MNFWITIEWDEQCGILVSRMFPLPDGLKDSFRNKNYGASISEIGVIMTCMARDFKQRKRYKKDTREFTYDILLDSFLVKNVDIEQKKSIIRRQMIKITEQTFSKYKFDNFDIPTFLLDLKQIVNTLEY